MSFECYGCSEPNRCGCPWGVPDVDYGPVWVDVVDTPTKPPYGSPARAAYDAADWDCGSGRCDPNTGCPECSDEDRVWVRRR